MFEIANEIVTRNAMCFCYLLLLRITRVRNKHINTFDNDTSSQGKNQKNTLIKEGTRTL